MYALVIVVGFCVGFTLSSLVRRVQAWWGSQSWWP